MCSLDFRLYLFVCRWTLMPFECRFLSEAIVAGTGQILTGSDVSECCLVLCHPLSKFRAVWSSSLPLKSKDKLSGVPRWAFILPPLSIVQMTGQLAAQSEWGEWITRLKLLKKTRECLQGHGEQCEGGGWSEKTWLCLKLLSMIERHSAKPFLTNRRYQTFTQWAFKAPGGIFLSVFKFIICVKNIQFRSSYYTWNVWNSLFVLQKFSQRCLFWIDLTWLSHFSVDLILPMASRCCWRHQSTVNFTRIHLSESSVQHTVGT